MVIVTAGKTCDMYDLSYISGSYMVTLFVSTDRVVTPCRKPPTYTLLKWLTYGTYCEMLDKRHARLDVRNSFVYVYQ